MLLRLGASALLLVVSALLTGCGGDCLRIGGCDDGLDASSAPDATGSVAQLSQVCGATVGPHSITGSVLDVHDGDTLTVGYAGTRTKVRLDGIDAPELSQPFGAESRDALSRLVMNKAVTVTFAKTDFYGRIVGAVFSGDCSYVNLRQVETGLAWYYARYQCELSKPVRDQFQAAQDAARLKRWGLWAQSQPVAPWVHRNGTDPQAPLCDSDLPVWASALEEFGGVTSSSGSGAFGPPPAVTCGAKTTCSQMTSCPEARAFLNQCGVSTLDADGDGIPCEALCGG